MFNRYLTIFVLTLYCYLAGYTNVSGEAGQGITGRVIPADFFMLLVIGISFLFSRKINLLPNFALYAAFLLVMLSSLMFSKNPDNGWIEILVHLFSFVTTIALFNLISNTRNLTLSDVVSCFFYAMIVIAFLSMLQFTAFPEWFGGRQVGGLVGTFRNTGQAGTFFGTGLAVFIPALAAGLLKRKPLNIAGILLILICLIMTVKRASMLGIGIGFIGFMILIAVTSQGADRKRNIIFVILALIALPIVSKAVDLGTANVRGLENRFERKVENFTVDEFSSKFFGSNIRSAVRAFEENPVLGAGPGNIIGDYTDKYEIHSTPFSILSSTGLVGLSFYLIFLLHWTYSIWQNRGRLLMEEKFLLYFLPFLIGMIISWGYTYHVRKREFWIIYAIIAYTIYMVQKYRSTVERRRTINRSAPEQLDSQPQLTSGPHRHALPSQQI